MLRENAADTRIWGACLKEGSYLAKKTCGWKELLEKKSELVWTWRRGQMSLDRELRSEMER